jgi:hypothetical protein
LGASDAITTSGTDNFDITNNQIGRVTNFAINMTNGSSFGNIGFNDFGGEDMPIANGISISGGSNNINVYHNRI